MRKAEAKAEESASQILKFECWNNKKSRRDVIIIEKIFIINTKP